jgi:hypothetical protein
LHLLQIVERASIVVRSCLLTNAPRLISMLQACAGTRVSPLDAPVTCSPVAAEEEEEEEEGGEGGEKECKIVSPRVRGGQ